MSDLTPSNEELQQFTLILIEDEDNELISNHIPGTICKTQPIYDEQELDHELWLEAISEPVKTWDEHSMLHP